MTLGLNSDLTLDSSQLKVGNCHRTSGVHLDAAPKSSTPSWQSCAYEHARLQPSNPPSLLYMHHNLPSFLFLLSGVNVIGNDKKTSCIILHADQPEWIGVVLESSQVRQTNKTEVLL